MDVTLPLRPVTSDVPRVALDVTLHLVPVTPDATCVVLVRNYAREVVTWRRALAAVCAAWPRKLASLVVVQQREPAGFYAT